VRDRAGAGLRALLRPGGEMLVVQGVRPDGTPYTEEPPWLLDEAEVRALAADDVHLVSLDRQDSAEETPWPMWTAVFRRDG
jgi:hypothetical protein